MVFGATGNVNATDRYLRDVLPEKPYADHSKRKESWKYWIQTHPKEVKVAELVLGLGGVCLMGEGLYHRVASHGAGGILCTAVATVAYKVLDLVCPPKHSMKDHYYKNTNCTVPKGTEYSYDVGMRIRYSQDIPVVSHVRKVTPWQMGYGQGYLTGKGFQDIREKLNFAEKYVGGVVSAKKVPRLIEK